MCVSSKGNHAIRGREWTRVLAKTQAARVPTDAGPGFVSLLVTGDFWHHVPDVLDERQQRGDREALDVAVGAVVERVFLSRGGADAVGLNALRAELGLIACAGGHGREHRGAGIDLPGHLPHRTI